MVHAVARLLCLGAPSNVWSDCKVGARLALDTLTSPTFPVTGIEDSDFADTTANIMASCAVESALKVQLQDCRRLAVLAATLSACSCLGVRRLRAILAPEGSSESQQPAGKAFLAQFQLCGGTIASVRTALRMYIGDTCACLGPAPPGADIAAGILEAGSRFIVLKESAALKFSAKDLPGALRLYDVATGLMLSMWAGVLQLPQERRKACALELGKVNAYMSQIELRRGNAHHALNLAVRAVAADPSWFKAHARRGAALAALRRHAEASAAFAVAADLAPMPRDAAECRRQEAAQLQLANDADAARDTPVQQQLLQESPGQGGASSSAAAAGAAAADGAPARSSTAAAAATAAELASLGPVLRALAATTQDAAMALAEYMRPPDLASLERTCRVFGGGSLHRRMRVRRAVRCQLARSLGRSAAAAALPPAAVTAGLDAAVRTYCDAATNADACAALEALAAAVAALVAACGAAAAAADPSMVALALMCAVGLHASEAERCAFWRACAARAPLQEAVSCVGDVRAVKFLLRELTAPLAARTRCMNGMGEDVFDRSAPFELVAHDFAGVVAAGLRRVHAPRAAAATAAAVAEFTQAALQTLYTLFFTFGGPRMHETAVGAAVTWHTRAFGNFWMTLPRRLPAERAPAALAPQQRAEVAAQLPPRATPGTARAHYAYVADAAAVRAALEADDARALRVWRAALRPVGDWLAHNRWGYLAPLVALATVCAARKERHAGLVANEHTLAAYLLQRGARGGGIRARRRQRGGPRGAVCGLLRDAPALRLHAAAAGCVGGARVRVASAGRRARLVAPTKGAAR
ncbi:hypothetical protein JKP88DRAFT_333660 [Tribonema minus]|uniref:Uncharacterized protein n=1 Tax=Tribonema minus TaxID=303371 RepID=A0A835YUX1_9STRA|nr:hypothetical protein JKP88DRAFT_333660 [Tribonema minus]